MKPKIKYYLNKTVELRHVDVQWAVVHFTCLFLVRNVLQSGIVFPYQSYIVQDLFGVASAVSYLALFCFGRAASVQNKMQLTQAVIIVFAKLCCSCPK